MSLRGLRTAIQRHANPIGAGFFWSLTAFLAGAGVFSATVASGGAGAFYWGLSAALLGGAVLSAYESAALTFALKPITQHVRYAWHRWPGLSALGILAAGVLGGHVFWPGPQVHGWFVVPIVGFACALGAHFWWGPPDTRPDDVNP